METILKISDLCVEFPSRNGNLPAVRDLSFAIPQAGIACLVGESGCGKSLTCRSILRLTPDNATLSGRIEFEGENLLEIPEKKLQGIRGGRIGMIFQEPMTSLNPVLTVGKQTAEPLRLHLKMKRRAARAKVLELFASVGIPSPQSRYGDYPHQLSGGMRQRIMIAMALACDPAVLIADEPTTALDTTIQGQILRLIRQQSRERGLGVLLITHDLGVVAEVADIVGVMYAGFLVEEAPVRELFAEPLHPYTRGLIASAPGRNSFTMGSLPTIHGSVPSLNHMPSGCPFQPRCPEVMPVCLIRIPPVTIRGAHRVKCWRACPNFSHLDVL